VAVPPADALDVRVFAKKWSWESVDAGVRVE
jgi:hypothetical protein